MWSTEQGGGELDRPAAGLQVSKQASLLVALLIYQASWLKQGHWQGYPILHRLAPFTVCAVDTTNTAAQITQNTVQHFGEASAFKIAP